MLATTPAGLLAEATMQAEWFAARLRELREARGLTRKELAAKAGLKSQAGIRNLEQGVRAPSWPTVVALCKAMGISCDEFMKPPTGGSKPAAGEDESAK